MALDKDKIDAIFKHPGERFINREISWIEFDQRVTEESNNKANPLLERLKFLSIAAKNLDEFCMVRVAGLQAQIKHNQQIISVDGLAPNEQLSLLYVKIGELVAKQQKFWKKLQKALYKNSIYILHRKNLSNKLKKKLERYFFKHIFPAITPFTIDAAHPFPTLPNLSIAVIIEVIREGKHNSTKLVIPLPPKLKRFIQILDDDKEVKLITLEEIILLFWHYLSPESVLLASGVMRITRDSELTIIDRAEDIILDFEMALKERRTASVIRVQVDTKMPKNLIELIEAELELEKGFVIESHNEFIGLSSISELYDIDLPDLKFTHYEPCIPQKIIDHNYNYFHTIAAKDLIVHHPYESFDTVVEFLHQAARDPEVIAIKQTLYRTSNDSEIVKALLLAASEGKSVIAVVELKARFDEEANIKWARDLEKAGAQVVYGVMGLKIHAKVSIIVRRSKGGLKQFVHFGTGNYHPISAKVYTDISYFTCKPKLCEDACHLFNFITGYSIPEKLNKIAFAPINLRETLVALIDKEIEFAKAGKPATIWLKVNALVDHEIIDKLYEASQEGVIVELMVRGMCSLRPGIKGFSDNIRVKAILGRFLEHSRIFCFGNGHQMPSDNAKIYISSADVMRRNLSQRIEAMVPIEDSDAHWRMIQILCAHFSNHKQSWIMNSDGRYTREKINKNSLSIHEFFMKYIPQ